MSNGKYKDSKTANKDAFWAPELQQMMERRRKLVGVKVGKLFGKKDRLLKQQYADARRIMAKVPVSKRKKNNGPS